MISLIRERFICILPRFWPQYIANVCANNGNQARNSMRIPARFSHENRDTSATGSLIVAKDHEWPGVLRHRETSPSGCARKRLTPDINLHIPHPAPNDRAQDSRLRAEKREEKLPRTDREETRVIADILPSLE